MITFFEGTSRSLRLLVAIPVGILILIFGWISISTIFLHSVDEILYSGEIVVTTCKDFIPRGKKDNSTCVTAYELKVGNTGTKDQELVRIRFRNLQSLRESEPKMLDIFASTKKQREPEIRRIFDENLRTYEIAPFPANKMIILKFFAIGYEDYTALKDLNINIHARGKVLKGDPQMTTFTRIFKTFFGIFI